MECVVVLICISLITNDVERCFTGMCFHSCNSLCSLLFNFTLNITILFCYLIVFMIIVLMASNISTSLACEMSAIVWQFEDSLALPFFEVGMKN